jgi:hypothetical protein
MGVVSTVRSWGTVAGADSGMGAGLGLRGGSLRKPDVTGDAEPIEDRFMRTPSRRRSLR